MKKSLFTGLLVSMACACVFAETEETNDTTHAEIASMTNRTELTVLEKELEAQIGELSSTLYKTLATLRATRERAMQDDPQLRTLNQTIARLQEQIDELLLEKYPELEEWDARRDELAREHENLRAALLAIRERKAELSTPDASPAARGAATGPNQSEIESENNQ